MAHASNDCVHVPTVSKKIIKKSVSKRAVGKYNHNICHIYNDYFVYIGYIQLSSEVL